MRLWYRIRVLQDLQAHGLGARSEFEFRKMAATLGIGKAAALALTPAMTGRASVSARRRGTDRSESSAQATPLTLYFTSLSSHYSAVRLLQNPTIHPLVLPTPLSPTPNCCHFTTPTPPLHPHPTPLSPDYLSTLP
jgi:hypothetical protein